MRAPDEKCNDYLQREKSPADVHMIIWQNSQHVLYFMEQIVNH